MSTPRYSPRFAGRSLGWILLACVLWLWPAEALAAGMSDETFYEIVLLLSVVSVGYVIAHVAVERLSRRFAVAGGVEYVALGVVLGPALGILDAELVRDIRPLLLLGAGALGMLAGLELGSNEGRRPVGAWRAALSITLFTALVVIAVPLGVASALGHDVRGSESWTAALLLAGVVALGTDGGVVRTVAAAIGARGPAPELGVAVATRVRALATIGFGLIYALVDKQPMLVLRDAIGVASALGVQLGAGVVIGLLFGVVVHRKLDERTLLTVVVGMVLLGGGFAFALGVSAIFVNFVAGLTFARTSPFAGQATDTMRSIKHPFVIALYFFAGLEWVVGELWVYALILPFWLLRRVGRRLGGLFGGRLVGSDRDYAPATFAPGGLTLAFALSFALTYRKTPGIVDVYGPLVLALVLLELNSLRAVRRWLVDVSDVAPAPAPTPPPS